jgi:hypothetical protein
MHTDWLDLVYIMPEEQKSQSAFTPPQWMVGVVLIFGVAALWGGFSNPIWWLIGLPCILTLFVYIFVRIKSSG